METSYFSRLAPELRNRIYEYALTRDRAFEITIYSDQEGLTQVKDTSARHPLGLAMTCRAMREECTELFYSLNTFTVKASNPRRLTKIFDNFRAIIGPRNASSILSVVLKPAPLEIDSFETIYATLHDTVFFLENVASLKSGSMQRCIFLVVLEFNAFKFHNPMANFVLDLSFDDQGVSLDEHLERAMNEIKCWQRGDYKPILFILEECRRQLQV